MAEGEDFIMRPIPHGYYDLADIHDGKITLIDIARANEHLDVKQENERLARESDPDGR